ncbi:S24/S26 family peptidase [Romboutsia sp. Marseille-P6047]|uniref:S24/S26 family peptidase n=2 Tax=unclassified Romboutsia TaxID=2626894 RepID=UPI001FAA22F4
MSGYSMNPFLKNNRDSVILESPRGYKLRRGDIVFIKRKSDEYVLHRIFKIINDKAFIMNGDAQVSLELVEFTQVIAVVKKSIIKGKEVDRNNLINRCLVYIWTLLRPFRFYIFKLYTSIKRLSGKFRVR